MFFWEQYAGWLGGLSSVKIGKIRTRQKTVAERVPPARFEPESAINSTATVCENPPTPVGAESGAIPANGQNLEVLAALVGILTTEQKAAFLALLTAPKPGA